MRPARFWRSSSRPASVIACFSSGSRAASGQLLHRLAETLRAIGEPLLFGGEPPARILTGAAGRRARRFIAEPALRLRDLARLELQIAHRAPAFFRPRALHPLFDAAKPFTGLRSARAGLLRILAAQIAGGVPHLFGNLTQLLALGALRTGRALLSLARLSLLACWPVGLLACWPAGAAGSAAASSTALRPAGAALPDRASIVRAAASLPRRSSDPCSCARSRCCFDKPFLPARQLADRRERILFFLVVLAAPHRPSCSAARSWSAAACAAPDRTASTDPATGGCRCRRRRWPAASPPAGGEFPPPPSAIRRAPALRAAAPAPP